MPLQEALYMLARIREENFVDEIDGGGATLYVQENGTNGLIERGAHDRIAGRTGK